VFVENITVKDYKIARKIVGNRRKLIWWSNYPVNDLEQSVGMFNLGGFQGPKKEVLENLCGIVVNPMREAYSNLPFYITFSNYLVKKDSYKRGLEWKSALEYLVGSGASEIGAVIRNYSQRNVVDHIPGWRIKNSKFRLSNIQARWGKLFVKSISSIFDQAGVFSDIVLKIRRGELVEEEEVGKLIFPTRMEIPRYYPEIFKIVSARLALIDLNQGEQKRLNKFKSIYDSFNKKYVGGKKLSLADKDAQMYGAKNMEILEFEVNIFTKYFKSREVGINKKLKVLSTRQNINRFFY
jgi:hypothetical protein